MPAARVLFTDLTATLGAEATACPPDVQAEVLALFDACAPRLRRYVRSSGLSPQAADDVVQETFLSLFRHLRLGRSRENLHGWLFTVAYRLALKQRARVSRHRSRECWLDPELADAIIDASEDPERRLAGREYRRRLRVAIEALPERQRQCLYLRAEGLRYREIARVLGISLGGVAKSLTLAAVHLSEVKE
jgi:RNA polymerase sigma-70 factor (ECF subfamily)